MASKLASIRVSGLAVLFSVATCAGADPQQPEKQPSAHLRKIGTKMAARGIPNFRQVNATLYRGGVPSPEALKGLKKMGVDFVVDMRGGQSEAEETAVTGLGVQYVSLSWLCPFPKDEAFAKFLRLIRENPGENVFVHCRLGDDRTGMAVASYRMAEEGWPAEDAMKEMRKFGFTRMHYGICPWLAG
jgi:protein tyrosine/serine phosphatase